MNASAHVWERKKKLCGKWRAGVLLWADMNAATPLGAWGCSVRFLVVAAIIGGAGAGASIMITFHCWAPRWHRTSKMNARIRRPSPACPQRRVRESFSGAVGQHGAIFAQVWGGVLTEEFLSPPTFPHSHHTQYGEISSLNSMPRWGDGSSVLLLTKQCESKQARSDALLFDTEFISYGGGSDVGLVFEDDGVFLHLCLDHGLELPPGKRKRGEDRPQRNLSEKAIVKSG